jgi:cyclophilin family peptidyl-prolyl cis-trans isomerase
MEGFMAQTGDPNGNGTGGSSLPNIPAEFSSTPFTRGTVGMARSSDPNSANSQFFICLADAPFLNGKYTVVGTVTGGMEAVDKIKKAERNAPGGAVQNPDKIVTMQLAGMNGAMAPEVQTVFLPASIQVRPITATLVRQIAGMGGDVSPFVPAAVAARLRQRFAAHS